MFTDYSWTDPNTFNSHKIRNIVNLCFARFKGFYNEIKWRLKHFFQRYYTKNITRLQHSLHMPNVILYIRVISNTISFLIATIYNLYGSAEVFWKYDFALYFKRIKNITSHQIHRKYFYSKRWITHSIHVSDVYKEGMFGGYNTHFGPCHIILLF